MTLKDKAVLYRVVWKVQPLPKHPQFWAWQFGYLNVWLYADSPEAAANTGTAIIDLLPYERVGSQARVDFKPAIVGDDHKAANDDKEGPSEETKEKIRVCEREAGEIGFSLMLIAAITGADETGFESSPL